MRMPLFPETYINGCWQNGPQAGHSRWPRSRSGAGATEKASAGSPCNWLRDSLTKLPLFGLLLAHAWSRCAGFLDRWPHHRAVWTRPHCACSIPAKLQNDDLQRIIAICASAAAGHVRPEYSTRTRTGCGLRCSYFREKVAIVNFFTFGRNRIF